MDNIKRRFDAAKVLYDRGESVLSSIEIASAAALTKLSQATDVSYGRCGGKQYTVLRSGTALSRPFIRSLMLEPSDFGTAWNTLISAAEPADHRFQVTEEHATKTVYSAVMAFALCYDLWKPKSRKTPGTFLEIVLGSLLSLLAPEAVRGKSIKLPNNGGLVDLPSVELVAELEADAATEGQGDVEIEPESAGSVSTDIVFEFGEGEAKRGVVIPAKITTRERIVQPFAHQRILDSAFGLGRYISLIVCVSETQRDDRNTKVNEICVPGTIKLFQQYLARVDGLYYLDPPQRYLTLSDVGVINVRSVGSLLTSGFDHVVRQLQTTQPG